MAISISTHSVPIEPQELDGKEFFDSIIEQVKAKDNFEVQNREEGKHLVMTWEKPRKQYTSRMNRDLGIAKKETDIPPITNAIIVQFFPKDGTILFSRDRTFKLRSIRNLLKELFDNDEPSIQGVDVSKDRIKELKKTAEDQGIRTTQVRVRETKNKGAIELDRLTYSDMVDDLHTEIMENEDVHQEFLKLSYSDILRESDATVRIMLYLNNDRIEGNNYMTYNVRVDYGDKDMNEDLKEDLFWSESVYYFVNHQQDLPKKQKTFDRFS